MLLSGLQASAVRIPVHVRGMVALKSTIFAHRDALSAYLRHRIILLISKFWQGLPKFGERVVGILLLQKKKDAKETT